MSIPVSHTQSVKHLEFYDTLSGQAVLLCGNFEYPRTWRLQKLELNDESLLKLLNVPITVEVSTVISMIKFPKDFDFNQVRVFVTDPNSMAWTRRIETIGRWWLDYSTSYRQWFIN